MVRKENYKEKKKQNFHWKKCTKKFEWNTMQKKKKKKEWLKIINFLTLTDRNHCFEYAKNVFLTKSQKYWTIKIVLFLIFFSVGSGVE